MSIKGAIPEPIKEIMESFLRKNPLDSQNNEEPQKNNSHEIKIPDENAKTFSDQEIQCNLFDVRTEMKLRSKLIENETINVSSLSINENEKVALDENGKNSSIKSSLTFQDESVEKSLENLKDNQVDGKKLQNSKDDHLTSDTRKTLPLTQKLNKESKTRKTIEKVDQLSKNDKNQKKKDGKVNKVSKTTAHKE